MRTMNTFDNNTGMNNSVPEVLEILQKQLAGIFDLFSQTKQAHWNLKGPHFIALHEMLDDLAGSMRDHSDSLAERMVALGGYPLGHVAASAKDTYLEAPSSQLVRDMDWISFMLTQYGSVSVELYKDIAVVGEHDPASEDLLIEIVRDVDQFIYFLGSHVG